MNNTATLEKQLLYSAVSILEEMCFLFPENITNREESAPEAITVISFDGPQSGKIVIKTYGDLLCAISENMSGQDTLPKEKQLDALGEYANMLCGNFLPVLSEEGSDFTIHHPQASTDIDSLEEDSSPSVTADISMDEGEMSISLFV